jgi:hypothetical protein
MRLIATITAFVTLATSGAHATWVHDASRDAVVTQASSYTGPGQPELVLVCNNMMTLTYVRWPSDFGVDKKLLPTHLAVDYSLSDEDTRTLAFNDQIWTVSRPHPGATQVITHDLILPERMIRSTVMTVVSGAKETLPGLTARFDLTGLQQILSDTYLPCSSEDKFLLKSEKELEAEQEAISNASKNKGKIAPPPLPNFDP